LQSTRYFACPRVGFYEITRVAAPKGACRSWLLAPDRDSASDKLSTEISPDAQPTGQDGYVLQSPDLFIATPIDPLFLVLPTLWPDSAQNFKTFHDRLFLDDEDRDRYVQLENLLTAHDGKPLREMLEKRMAAVSTAYEMAGFGTDSEMHYSLDVDKLCLVMWSKAQNMVEVGLPASLEEKFVRQMLEVPVLSVQREESGVSVVSRDDREGAENANVATAGNSETISVATSTDTTFTPVGSSLIAAKEEGPVSACQATKSLESMPDAPSISASTDSTKDSGSAAAKITHLLRLRTALNFVLSSYIPPDLCEIIVAKLNKPHNPMVDFRPLDERLAQIESMKRDVQALRAISDNVSRKRGVLGDDEALEKAETKRRKKEEEEAKKKNMSQGVKKLMKADTSNMKKLSTFFTKAPPKKA